MISRVLFLGAHTDDIELMCGGTISKFIEMGINIYYTTFTFAKKSLPEGVDEYATMNESKLAIQEIGIPRENVSQFDFEVRNFPEIRQELLEVIVRLKNEIEPEIVITHSSADTHQDHKVISEESYRAFKQSASIWGYESMKNDRSFPNDVYVALSKDHINKKINALSKYESQLMKGDFLKPIKSLAIYRGSQINQPFAECYEAMRILI